jgi:hypothetical protein
MVNSVIIVKNVVLLLPGGTVLFQSKTVLFGLRNGLSGDKHYKEFAIKADGVKETYAVTLKNVWRIFLNGDWFNRSE